MDRRDAASVPRRARIREDAERLANHYGLDVDRVERILERTARDPEGNLVNDRPDEITPGYEPIFYAPSLESALGFLGAGDALPLFEHGDPDALHRRDLLHGYLLRHGPFLPLYTPDELVAVLESFRAHLLAHRADYVLTGLPPALASFGWLNAQLLPLYQTRQYRERRPRRLAFPPRPYHRHSRFLWTSTYQRRRAAEYRRAKGLPPLDVAFAWPVPYESAPPLPTLTPEDLGRADARREQFFAVVVDVLAALRRAVDTRARAALWPACLRLLTDQLTADDVDFYLRLDQSWGGRDFRDMGGDAPHGSCSGLTGLLEVIGSCEEALAVGSLVNLRQVLRGSDILARLDDPWELPPHYFEIRDNQLRRRLDAALDAFLAAQARVANFWEEYRRRVNDALAHEFCDIVRVVTETRVPRRVAHRFEPHLRDYTDLTRLHLVETGSPPPLPLVPMSRTLADVGTNVFRLDGDFWTVRYEGAETRLRDSKGMRYLAYLLRDPTRVFFAGELHAAVAGHPGEPNRLRDASREELAEEGMHRAGGSSADPVLDDVAREQYKARLNELQEAIEEAREIGNWERADELESERDFIYETLREATGIGGRPRRQTNNAERARQAVTQAIRRAIVDIGAHHPALAQHLRTTIQTGRTIAYTPSPPVSWTT